MIKSKIIQYIKNEICFFFKRILLTSPISGVNNENKKNKSVEYDPTIEKKPKQTRDDDEFFFMGFGISN